MSPVSPTRIGALVAVVACLTVISSGCIAQDRPEHAEFFVVANAGEDQVVPAGDPAHFEWAEEHAVEAEGGAPHVDIEYSWHVSGQAEPISQTSTASYTQNEVGLALVSLEVAAEGGRATDTAAVFVGPAEADTATHAYVAVIGPGLHFYEGALKPGEVVNDAEVEGLSGQWMEVQLPSNPSNHVGAVFTFSDVDVALASEVEGSLIVVVKRGAGPAEVAMTGQVTFDAANWYEVTIPGGHGAIHLWVTPRGSTTAHSFTFDEYAADHAVESESRTLVTESQALAGFEGAAAAAAIAVGALALARRRP